MKYLGNYQNVTQKHEVRKCCWKMVLMYLLEVSVATNMKKSEKTKQNKKPSGSAKHNKMKHKTRYYCTCACVLSCFSHVRIFVTLWTVVLQAPLSMGFSRQEYCSGLLCSPPGRLPNPGIETPSLMSPALAGRSFTTRAN